MYDPIGGFNRVREHYLRYLETAFRIADPAVSVARRRLLERAGQLCTEPYIEPIPRYRSVDWRLSELAERGYASFPGFDETTMRILQRLIPVGLFDSTDIALYRHQAEMLEKGVREATPGVVTSGTGSGKTESFLLPIIAKLCLEASTSEAWHTPAADYLRSRWWHDRDGRPYEKFTSIPKNLRPLKANPESSPFRHHRTGEDRPAAVRALILYPMNALVEDQLARIRRALDSPLARAVVGESFEGNRFFFGRYTGQTPVTGHHEHPRLAASDYLERRKRSLSSLFEKSLEMERTQDWIRKEIAEGSLDEEVRYLFPSVDGSELVSRWDMQEAPPDILISNISMLGAMLNREVDSPIFDRTREWIESDDDAYFFLVVDELHLHRGTAGTEVAYLIRLLLHRLGLTSPEHRHKLRILASSASMPSDGEEGLKSLAYLTDMFGQHGLHSLGGKTKGLEEWTSAIVPGEAVYEPATSAELLDPKPFEDLVGQLGGTSVEPVADGTVPDGLNHDALWESLSVAIGLALTPGTDSRTLVVGEVARRLTEACWSEEDSRYRATSISDLAAALFGDGARLDATRGLLLVRGLGDLQIRNQDMAVDAPAFRLHTFFRAIEGLYAPLDSTLSGPFGELSIERSYAVDGARPLDLLYCESCGALLVGGRRSSGTAGGGRLPELTPVADNLDEMPERLSSDRFEDQTHMNYAVFYPTDSRSAPKCPDEKVESWRESWLDPVTGQLQKKPAPDPDSLVHGWSYSRKGQDRHKRSVDMSGTHVPYQCASCETDYSLRRAGSARLSPIRHFRPGFAKTTQLLSSELFDLLKLGNQRAKLVSFSDSRQEAAKAALDIEGRHHEDLRRQVLFAGLKGMQADRPVEVEAVAEIERLTSAADLLGRETPNGRELLSQARLLTSKIEAGPAVVGPLAEVLADHQDRRQFSGSRTGGREPLGSLLRTYAEKGIHPFDPAGVDRVKATVGEESRDYEWTELFEIRDGVVDWRDRSDGRDFLDSARQTVLKESHRNLTEVLFSKTYFSMEESGVGYPCLSDAAAGERAHEVGSAWVRVFADAYRLADSPFDEPPRPIHDPADLGPRNRARKFAMGVWGEDEWVSQMATFLGRLAADGHEGGLIGTAMLFVRLSDPDDPAWRCAACARVHLHLGVGRCTRCFRALPDEPTTTAGKIAEANYIGRKVGRSTEPFRLHCEELTGQTDDGAARQRAFKDVLIPDLRPKKDSEGEIVRNKDGEIIYADSDSFWPEREAIDMLTVTTTMEVGIDIGSLQAVVQANMPPQRFNYQQRVGRAGRRGQAFSMALTVCRTKSHDLHYFRNPRAMTGDVPPPPFLARSRAEIARRFLWKHWLNEAFADLRRNATEWPADEMRPPDIHGEFLPIAEYKEDRVWRRELLEALKRTEDEALKFVGVLADSELLDAQRVSETPARVVEEIDIQVRRAEVERTGLAHTLAEGGLLPMYGMPTRVRNLYTGLRRSAEGREWRTIDRDVDIAIYEFAPGSTIIKDKRTHTCVGFTGPLPPPRPGQKTLAPFSEPFGPEFWMAECPSCRSWYRGSEQASGTPCRECGHDLGQWYPCREPLGFRTDFRPQVGQLDQATGRRNRSVQAESFILKPTEVVGTNALVQVKPATRTYRMNRGDWSREEDAWSGFTAASFTQATGPRRRSLSITDQWLDFDAIEHSKIFTTDLVEEGGQLVEAWLAAPKTTDVMLLAPKELGNGLGIHLLERLALPAEPTPADRLVAAQATAIRAAAMSAAYLLVYRSALELDVDPEEFDIIEPRMASFPEHRAPVLQFADFLVNGAGLSSALGERGPNSEPRVGSILRSIVEDSDAYPLKFFASAEHVSGCRSACYQCLLRHSNQPVHGLLDWRLGLAFLGVLNSATDACGLDGDLTKPALADWQLGVERSLAALARRVPTVQSARFGTLDGFRLGPGGRAVVICHPLWDSIEPQGILRAAMIEAGPEAVAVDSFTLTRRPWLTRERVESLGDGTPEWTPVSAAYRGESLLAKLRSAGLPDPLLDYTWDGYTFAPISLAWPGAPQATCFVESHDLDRDRWLTEEGWAIFGAGEEEELVQHLRRK